MSVYLYFDKGKLTEGEGFPGVPAHDLTQEEYDGLPAYLQAAVSAHPAYRKTRPKAASDEQQPEPAGKE